ncbi:MAG: photosynthetic reaction center cytochrome PufC [Novosphingobium meiothermophilum]|uniref:photosynthetic reaction center cytochrome PufC n=1 Tax=Novosphingobium TaxID=165696 RepID=UPI000D6EAD86|nr:MULTISPECIES: photosynthetic reaction center cytochrome PufC [Novosphingobium]
MKRTLAIAAMATAALTLAGCELGPKQSVQNGHRGTGMDTIKLKKVAMAKDDVPAPPYDMPTGDGPKAATVYQNVQVLGDVTEEQFTYTMAAITNWIAPEQGCNYCHNPENMASDEIYTKVVARKMLQMTRNINTNWNKHVGTTGVTCWTCHRGQAVPANYWALPEPGKKGVIGNLHGQNSPVAASAYSSLPTASLAMYLTGDPKTDKSIRVVSKGIHPSSANTLTTMQTEPQYALMMHLSTSLGVNCTFCHNAQAFQPWNISTPQRATAWYGLRMVRDVNGQYISPLADTFPAHRKGPMGDPFKVSCATCHQGKNKPMDGYKMAKDYPALWGSPVAVPAAAPAAPEQPAAPAVTTATH